MSAPKTTDSYPPEYLAAILRAHEVGEVVIPTDNPDALRLRFNGLRGALRREGRGELADMVSFLVVRAKDEQPGYMRIMLRAADPLVADVAAALKNPAPIRSAALVEQENTLARLLGET